MNDDSLEPIPDGSGEAPPANWREAAADLVSARLALIELEAQELGKGLAQKGLAAAILAGAAFFTWALLLAGGIALLSTQLRIDWGWLALGVAGIHLIVAIIAVVKLRKPSPPSFQNTRSEFQRDREWFKNL